MLLFFHLSSVRSFLQHSTFEMRKGNLVRNIASKINMRVKKGTDYNINLRGMSPLYIPKTDNQKQYVNYLTNTSVPIVLGIGPAGSGKTLFACNQAVMSLKKGQIQKIILTRPVVPVEEDIGFLPGNLIHKMDPWTRPIFDILLEYYTQKDIDSMLHSGTLEISPLAFMRGRTFKHAFIIADEMQNSSPNQMLMLTTRIGDESKLVITGDLQQSDRGTNNGLSDLMNKLKKYNEYCLKSGIDGPNISMVEMEAIDIQRSPIVSRLLEMYGEPVYKNVVLKTNNSKSDFIAGDASLLPFTQMNMDPSKFPWEPKKI
jgi:phosphate starvation-inducible PhoH-like protein